MADCTCGETSEGTAISDADAQRVRALLDPTTIAGRVCLRMLDRGETVDEACVVEKADAHEVMKEWHKLADANGILSTDGKRPCISVLCDAGKRMHRHNRGAAQQLPRDFTFSFDGTFNQG